MCLSLDRHKYQVPNVRWLKRIFLILLLFQESFLKMWRVCHINPSLGQIFSLPCWDRCARCGYEGQTWTSVIVRCIQVSWHFGSPGSLRNWGSDLVPTEPWRNGGKVGRFPSWGDAIAVMQSLLGIFCMAEVLLSADTMGQKCVWGGGGGTAWPVVYWFTFQREAGTLPIFRNRSRPVFL